MHLHENHYVKRAGVAGVRARAAGCRWSKSGAIYGPLARRRRGTEAKGAKKERPAGCCWGALV